MWLADMSRCAVGPSLGESAWNWPRLEVLVEGRVGSNRPAFAECLRECAPTLPVKEVGVEDVVALVGGRVRGESPFRGAVSIGECVPATERAAAADRAAVFDRVGREKLVWRLGVVALLAWEVKLL